MNIYVILHSNLYFELLQCMPQTRNVAMLMNYYVCRSASASTSCQLADEITWSLSRTEPRGHLQLPWRAHNC